MPYADKKKQADAQRRSALRRRAGRLRQDEELRKTAKLLAMAVLFLSGADIGVARGREFHRELRQMEKREWDRKNRPHRAEEFLTTPARKRSLEQVLGRKLAWAEFHLLDTTGARER